MTEFWRVPRLWPGETVVIVAGGPSVTCRQIRHIVRAKLDGRCRVIAVNDSAYLLWNADLVHGCDKRWWKEHPHLVKHPAVKTTLMEVQYPGIHRIRYRNSSPLETDPDYVTTGINAGYQAINIAVHCGAKRILLTGYDMKGAESKSHWFGDHEKFVTAAATVHNWRKHYDVLPAALKPLGIEVLNCTPGSALTVFPMADLEAVL